MPPSLRRPLSARCASAWFLLAMLPASAATVEVTALGSDGRPLPEAVVYLESPAAKAAARPLAGAQVAQIERRFSPRVTVVTVGSDVSFPNSDTVRHHVYSLSPAKTFELKLYIGRPAHPVSFDKPGVAVLGCNIHDHMAAWVVVVETPHFALTGPAGSLRLDQVPPGNYRLRSWHPGLAPGTPASDEALVVGDSGARVQVRLPVTAAAVAAGAR